jgi:predicted small secreted protein
MANIFRRVLAFAFVAAFGLGVSACNTFDGLGKDLNDAGKAIGLVDDENTN